MKRGHANDIRRRFADRNVTTGQIVIFGLTGGLIPCPASITVLSLRLQLKQVAMGAVLVLCFSVGLAATMVTVGVVAALGMRHAERRWSEGSATPVRAPRALRLQRPDRRGGRGPGLAGPGGDRLEGLGAGTRCKLRSMTLLVFS